MAVPARMDGYAPAPAQRVIHQVVMNLGTNALQAMENGGVLEVALDRADVAQSRRLSHGNLSPGKYVRLCVSDTGSGIPPHVLDRMFGEGTGLGLSLVHGIVTDLGGAIDVRTAVGQGTTFTIWLPTAGEATVPSAEVVAELPQGHGQTVMIVDDEKALVALSEEMLAGMGELAGRSRRSAARDSNDPVALYGDVALASRRSRAVNDRAAPDDDVVHCQSLPL